MLVHLIVNHGGGYSFHYHYDDLFSLFIYIYIFLATWHLGSQFPDQGSNPRPQQRKHRVPTTGQGSPTKTILKAYERRWTGAFFPEGSVSCDSEMLLRQDERLKFTELKRKEKWTERGRMGEQRVREAVCCIMAQAWVQQTCPQQGSGVGREGHRGGVQLWGHVAQFLWFVTTHLSRSECGREGGGCVFKLQKPHSRSNWPNQEEAWLEPNNGVNSLVKVLPKYLHLVHRWFFFIVKKEKMFNDDSQRH